MKHLGGYTPHQSEESERENKALLWSKTTRKPKGCLSLAFVSHWDSTGMQERGRALNAAPRHCTPVTWGVFDLMQPAQEHVLMLRVFTASKQTAPHMRKDDGEPRWT